DGICELLQTVIAKATAKNPEDRFQTAEAIADELQSYIDNGLLPDDPAKTPRLGTAPAHILAQAAVLIEAENFPLGGTMVPFTQVQVEGDKKAVQASQTALPNTWVGGIVDEDESFDVPPSRSSPVRNLLAFATLILLLLGGGVWFINRPHDPVTTIAVPDLIVEEVVPEVIHTSSVPEQPPAPEAEVEAHTPVASHGRVPVVSSVKVTPAPEVVIIQPPPEQEVSVTTKAQVRLILVGETTATVTLSGEGGTYTLRSGSLDIPQGTYRVSAEGIGREDAQTGILSVTPGLTVLRCDKRFKKCTGF
ncbi:hypothetical protein HQ487_01025, partial [Candidatus Uhrbacteria bacterium]|nr:hypothetical protein [Candidatus Uhrbacteria bacterium]